MYLHVLTPYNPTSIDLLRFERPQKRNSFVDPNLNLKESDHFAVCESGRIRFFLPDPNLKNIQIRIPKNPRANFKHLKWCRTIFVLLNRCLL